MAFGMPPWKGLAVFPIMNKVTNSRRPELPDGLAGPLVALITDCWAQDPAQRPGAHACINHLLALQEERRREEEEARRQEEERRREEARRREEEEARRQEEERRREE
eukprot:Hpha_TRINITY_DN15714_c0_g3::TRINITY_DN15714_c0_g3_i2::g.36452::m.36452